jgi:ATP phosphoribosyltransferase regulatory subunit
MTTLSTTLLPVGIYDLLPPVAAHHAGRVERAVQEAECHAYQRVMPPLLEFTESLLARSGKRLDRQTFRVMDAVSQRTMGLRADMTPQIGRIAISRLRHAPRPLRLCYAGEVVRVSGEGLYPSRQATQVGIELFGPDSVEADAEVMAVTASMLQVLGVEGISVDIHLPGFVGAVLSHAEITEPQRTRIRQALAHKDMAGLKFLHPSSLWNVLELCVRPNLSPDARIAGLMEHPLDALARRLLARLQETLTRLRLLLPDLTATLDLTEHRGFAYHHGISFALFARGHMEEIARGGRYLMELDGMTEQATGATIYMDVLDRDSEPTDPTPTVLIPESLPFAERRALHRQGYATLAIPEGADTSRYHATHRWVEGKVEERC